MAAAISLCMIVKDEEDVLDRCLRSIAPAVEEIIIADTGSVDRTREIARKYTRRVYAFPWREDFAAARNFSFSKATMDYCMWLDADDVILEKDLAALLRLKAELTPDVDVVMLPYHAALEDDGTPKFWYYRERILRNTPKLRWEGRVHEAIAPTGKVIYGEAAVTHRKLKPADPDRNLRILEQIRAEGKGMTPREQYYYGRELSDHRRFAEAAAVLERFWLEPEGWIENKIDASRILAWCYAMQSREDLAYHALFRSFTLDLPRAEICCELGRLFMEKNQYRLAAYWYETALRCPCQPDTGGFVLTDCCGYLPCIQLCVCYDRLGDFDRAETYNEMAGQYRPDSSAYLANKRYFAGRKQKENPDGKEKKDELS